MAVHTCIYLMLHALCHIYIYIYAMSCYDMLCYVICAMVYGVMLGYIIRHHHVQALYLIFSF